LGAIIVLALTAAGCDQSSFEPGAELPIRIAVNLRLAEPGAASQIVLDILDGLQTFEDLQRDGRCISDVWA